LKCVVLYEDNKAFIISKNPKRIVTTATIDTLDNNLYHLDDMNQFKVLSNFTATSKLNEAS
jgi:hypothetical protein